MSRSWSIEFWRIVLTLVLAWLAGAWLGYSGWSVAFGLAGLLAWQGLQLYRVKRWLSEASVHEPPSAAGVWADIVSAIIRLRRANRRRKRALTNMLDRFRESAAAMPDAIVILGPDGEIEWLNEAAAPMLGLHLRQDGGLRLTDLIRHPAVASYLAAEDYREPVEFPAPGHEQLRLSARVVPYGKNRRLITVRDVTRLHRLEAVRRDFVANVSHELRTPLTVITGYLETFGDDPYVRSSEAVARTVQQMEEQAERMRRLTEDLLTLARLETTSEAADDVRTVSVASLITDIENEARVLARAQGNPIRAEADSTLWLKGNAKEVYSAFLNLVSNAIHYSPGGGEICLRWYGDEEGAHFAVQDHGMGMEPQHIPRITERFYRVDKDRSRASGGTGIGLAIVKHVLQRHGAKLRVESAPGRGSTFTCDFPQARIERRSAQVKVINA